MLIANTFRLELEDTRDGNACSHGRSCAREGFLICEFHLNEHYYDVQAVFRRIRHEYIGSSSKGFEHLIW
jgi:hypothetical protein